MYENESYSDPLMKCSIMNKAGLVNCRGISTPKKQSSIPFSTLDRRLPSLFFFVLRPRQPDIRLPYPLACFWKQSVLMA